MVMIKNSVSKLVICSNESQRCLIEKKIGNHFLPILSMLSWYWNWDISVGKGNNAKKNKEQISMTVCRRGMSFKDQYGPIVDLYFIWKLSHDIVSGLDMGENRIYSSSTENCEH